MKIWKGMTEKAFEERIKKIFEVRGYWFIKTHGGSFQKSGIPDIIACVKGTFIGIELKADNGNVDELQKYNQRGIKSSGGLHYFISPFTKNDYLITFDKFADEMNLRFDMKIKYKIEDDVIYVENI